MFSTAGDVAIFAQMILNGGIYAHHRVVSRAMVTEFTAHQTVGASARTLGWDVALDASATGRFFSPHAFGHYGFTGTSLWIDPDHNLFIILLTNRVNPSVDNIKIRRVRPELHDTTFQALGLASSPVAMR
jgi:CubicO group peptidase (beta-lactamase class C family)